MHSHASWSQRAALPLFIACSALLLSACGQSQSDATSIAGNPTPITPVTPPAPAAEEPACLPI